MSLGSDLCPRILRAPEMSVLLHGPDLCWGILHNLCWGILYGLCGPVLCPRMLCGLYGLDRCPCIFLARPSLELLQQGLSWRLTDFGLTLIGRFRSGSNFVARRRVPCSRRQILSAGG
jgi:hypothetical protein